MTFEQKIVGICGTHPRAVEATVAFSRAAWQCAMLIPRSMRSLRSQVFLIDHRQLVSELDHAFQLFTSEPSSLAQEIIERLQQLRLAEPLREDSIALAFDTVLPLRLVRQLLATLCSDHDLRFFVARAIRRHYRCTLS